MRRRVTKFVNIVMTSTARRRSPRASSTGAFDIVAERAKDDPLKVWDRALGNVQPSVEVKSPPRRWLDLPGSRRRSPGPLAGARHALARRRTRATADEKTMHGEARERDRRRRRRTAATRSRSAKTCTRWPTPTRRSRTTAGSQHRRLSQAFEPTSNGRDDGPDGSVTPDEPADTRIG